MCIRDSTTTTAGAPTPLWAACQSEDIPRGARSPTEHRHLRMGDGPGRAAMGRPLSASRQACRPAPSIRGVEGQRLWEDGEWLFTGHIRAIALTTRFEGNHACFPSLSLSLKRRTQTNIGILEAGACGWVDLNICVSRPGIFAIEGCKVTATFEKDGFSAAGVTAVSAVADQLLIRVEPM